jgi:phospholipid/cholesterol/gamma-HCH transport system substrate-binding protein
MSERRTQIKVGLFVVLGITLMAGLLIVFSKSKSWRTGHYGIRLVTANAGGIIAESPVLMAGVPVGFVDHVELGHGGTNVTVHIRVDQRYEIRSDAVFTIDSSGFLGDQFISIRPSGTNAKVLGEGDTVFCAEPFNLQETARAAAGFITRIDATAERLNQAIVRVDRLLLNEETLTNLSATVRNFRGASERAVDLMDHLDGLVATNRAPIAEVLTNLLVFSSGLTSLTESLGGVITTNSATLHDALANVESATASLSTAAKAFEGTDGMVGSLLHDPALKLRTAEVMENLATLSSNLNRYGLLYKPKTALPRPMTNSSFPYPGKFGH